jgi:hypothetical protein
VFPEFEAGAVGQDWSMGDQPEAATVDVDINEVHRLVGAIVAAATVLERQLTSAVASLSRSPLTTIVVQGERGTSLIRMAQRLLKNGIGSVGDDEASGRTERLGLLSQADTDTFLAALRDAERLLDQRDAVAHSMWLANIEKSHIDAVRVTRSAQTTRRWTLPELERLRQDLANVAHDIFTCEWNTSGSGMDRIQPREGDVSG